MWYILNKDANLVGITNESPSQLEGVSVISREDPVIDLNKYVWDTDLLDFKQKSVQLTKLEFLSRFTMEERIAMRSSTDPILADIVKLVEIAEFIDLGDTRTQQSVGYLGMIGILSPTRVTEVLS